MLTHRTLAAEANKLERRQGLLDARRADLDRGAAPDPGDMITIQLRFDEIHRSLDLPGAPPPQRGESSRTYRRRLAAGLQPYCASPAARETNLFDLPSGTLAAIEQMILSEARQAAASGTQGDWREPHQLREVVRADDAGREIHEWAGDPLAWMAEHMGAHQFVRRFNVPNPFAGTQRRTVG